jgi:hypothetical protein
MIPRLRLITCRRSLDLDGQKLSWCQKVTLLVKANAWAIRVDFQLPELCNFGTYQQVCSEAVHDTE